MASNSDDFDICYSDEETSSGYSDADGTDLDFGYVLLDTEILFSFVSDVARCGERGESVRTFHQPSKKTRFCSLFYHLVY